MKNGIKKGTFSRLIKYIFSHYKIQMIVVIAAIIINALASASATFFLQRLIDECVTPGLEQGLGAVWSKLLSILITMGTIYLLGIIASGTYTRIMATVTQGTLKHFRDDMFVKMQTLPIKYFDTHAHGDIMSTYTNDVDAIRQLIGQSMPLVIQSTISIVSIICMMMYFSFQLTLIVIVFSALMVTVARKFAGASAKYMTEQQKSLAKEEGFIEEMMEGQKVIKVFCHEEESKKAFVKLNDQLFHDGDTANRYGNMLMPILANIGNLMYVVISIVGAVMVFLGAKNFGLSGGGLVTAGIIVSFLDMARQFSQTISQTSMQVSMIAMGLAGASRVFGLIDEKSEADEGYVSLVNAERNEDGTLREVDRHTGLWAWKHPHSADNTVTYSELKGDIVMEHVDFGYNDKKLVLKDISLYAKPGQKIAFVGATGAGKTTITNLINRFYDIPDGKIRYDGINIGKIKKPELRRSLGIVLQDVNLFTGTVMDNIRYGKLNATDEECIAAAKLANADSFIRRLPDGYNTMLTGNGSSLSQGQRQLISIARAAVADPPVMILDEATSSIDTRTEALVQKGMDNLMKGRTVFVIAHRLSTVKNSDAIMVLDHGRIIERGTHDELIQQKGTYFQLYTGAFELE
ncbi:ATP-binding cassette, subfamily B [Lachnospiraceae bacterium KH1T2]|nr:ATP-binding cassette, subfamily B [Lachnospiraceae bacterium KH1T2]